LKPSQHSGQWLFIKTFCGIYSCGYSSEVSSDSLLSYRGRIPNIGGKDEDIFFENQQFFAKWVKPSFSREPWCSYMLSLASRPASLIVLIGMGTIYFFRNQLVE